MAPEGILQKYREILSITPKTPMITMGEGNTPLVLSQSIGPELGCELYFKLEGCNPSGSFKDRGMVMAVAKALELGYRKMICASTGNTSASAAAYGARFDLETFVVVPSGNISLGKLTQVQAYGARVIALDGNFDEALQMVRDVAEQLPIALVNSINPHRLEGQKTAAFEIIEALGRPPDLHCLPVGNAGNITAYWQGYLQALDLELCSTTPRMMGFQAAGAAPIVEGQPIANPTTFATAICIGNPASWKGALAARDDSGGDIKAVTDDEIRNAYSRLLREEGLFCEPASAATVAGLLKLADLGEHLKGQLVVCVLTGNGLKDYDSAQALDNLPIEQVPANIDTVMTLLNGFAEPTRCERDTG